MSIAKEINLAIEVITIAHGLTFGLYLLLKPQKETPSSLLGILLLLSALTVTPTMLHHLGLEKLESYFAIVAFKCIWFIGPVFFLYSQKVSVFKENKLLWWAFIPGFISIIISVVYEIYEILNGGNFAINNGLETILFIIGDIYCLVILLLNYNYLNRHAIVVNDHFSSVQEKELRWAYKFVVFMIVLCLASILLRITSSELGRYRVPFALSLLLAMYWLAIHGIRQKIVTRVLSSPQEYGLTYRQTKSGMGNQSVNTENLKKLTKQLGGYFEKERPYRNPNLNLVEVSLRLSVHPKTLSNAINEIEGLNFNRFVNNYRIEEAQKLLLDMTYKRYTIEAIGNEVGFQSKSAFYSAFKSVTGHTPKKYRTKMVS